MSAGFGAHKLCHHVRPGLLYELLGRSAYGVNARLTYCCKIYTFYFHLA